MSARKCKACGHTYAEHNWCGTSACSVLNDTQGACDCPRFIEVDERPIQRFIFVGECRSMTAIKKGWCWEDGHLAAKPLFEALRAMGVEPSDHQFMNLYTDPPLQRHRQRQWKPKINQGSVLGLRVSPWIKVALGQRVSKTLTALGIDHVAIVHPAARGRIRKRAKYRAHVKKKLKGLT